MTNSERIRQMTDEELAIYIYSVYVAGKMNQRYSPENVDYEEWLKAPYIEQK